jgi:vacuolar-type H+-ATPase subunit C/Vma6
MSGTGERAYAYARACGIIGKSFVGKKLHALEKVNSLSELDRVFSAVGGGKGRLSLASVADFGIFFEKEPFFDLEKRIIRRAVNSIVAIVGSFSSPPELLTLLIRSYEYADLFSAITSSIENEGAVPGHIDLGRFQTVRFGAWPDIRAMIKGTEFEFLLHKDHLLDGRQGSLALQSEMDRYYYNALWDALLSLPGRDRLAAEKILSDEISLKNASWVLRLRTYYKLLPNEVKPHLIDIPADRKKPQGRSLACEAFQCLKLPLNDFSAWSVWRWRKFLNPGIKGRPWHVNPRYFQNAASRYLHHLAKHHFRLRPSSLDSIFCFIKLKQFEEDVLTSCAEGLGLGIPIRDTVSMLGVGQ